MALNNEQLLKYACAKFSEEKYDEALEMFVLAYMRGYEQEWIIETIYNCYIAGNDEEFRKAFQNNTEQCKDIYEECTLDFIPYRDGEYYIFDKEQKIFRGIFSVPDLKNADLEPAFSEMEFSAAVVELDWDWNKEKSVLSAARERKIYAICHDRKKCTSFFKIPGLEEYWKNVKVFSNSQQFQEYFHTNTAEYLPHILLGRENIVKQLETIIGQEHLYRLTPEGRNTENVLLTIGIPSYNRGNLLLKRLENLRRMPYDSEIEIAISKNGIEYYQEEYEEASRIPDARINYFAYNKTLKPTENWHNVVKIAHGKHVLFVSDEDDVIIEALEHYLKILQSYREATLIRARTVFQNASLTPGYAKKGTEAFKFMFLSQNYLSGLIVRRKDFLEEDLLRLEKYKDNAFYMNYPHEWWCALLTKRGDAVVDSMTLISEGESVLKEEMKAAREAGALKGYEDVPENLPVYSTYEARLEQFRGYIDFVHEILQENVEEVMIGLEQSIRKTTYLLLLARRLNYKCEIYESMVGRFCKIAMAAIEEFDLEDGEKIYLLNVLESSCISILQETEKWNMVVNEV